MNLQFNVNHLEWNRVINTIGEVSIFLKGASRAKMKKLKAVCFYDIEKLFYAGRRVSAMYDTRISLRGLEFFILDKKGYNIGWKLAKSPDKFARSLGCFDIKHFLDTYQSDLGLVKGSRPEVLGLTIIIE